MEHLRNTLDRYIDTTNLSDIEIVRIIEKESFKNDTFLTLSDLIGG